jgi:membrane protease YdiL (CAAX protease family)
MMSFLAFLFLGLALLSCWVRRESKIWGGLLGISLFLGMVAGNVSTMGVLLTIGWGFLWAHYIQEKRHNPKLFLLVLIVLLGSALRSRFFPGFIPLMITPLFSLKFVTPILGFFALALFVRLAQTSKDWKKVAQGCLVGCIGIALLAVCAVASGSIHWNPKIPSLAALRYLNNLILVAIPEEAFYRGFLQFELNHFLHHLKGGKWLSLLLSSVVFTLAHVGWCPNLAILGFVFLASLLYGGVFWISGKIESAIFTHFLLNFVHMTFFSYHAM